MLSLTKPYFRPLPGWRGTAARHFRQNPEATYSSLDKYCARPPELARNHAFPSSDATERDSPRGMQILARANEKQSSADREPGVGKTARGKALRRNCFSGDVRTSSRPSVPRSLGPGRPGAGAKFRGEFEDF